MAHTTFNTCPVIFITDIITPERMLLSTLNYFKPQGVRESPCSLHLKTNEKQLNIRFFLKKICLAA